MGDQSLPKDEILRRRSDFDTLFSYGGRTRFGCLTVIHREAPRRRVGFAVSRRVKGAAKAKRIRRLLREAYRRNKKRMAGDREFVILAGESALLKPYLEIERELIGCLRKAGIVGD